MQGLFQVRARSLGFVLSFNNRKALEDFKQNDKI